MLKKLFGLILLLLVLPCTMFGCVNNKHLENEYMHVYWNKNLDEVYFSFLSHSVRTIHEDIVTNDFNILTEATFYVYAEVYSSDPNVSVKFVKVNRKKITVYRVSNKLNPSWRAYLAPIKDFKNYQLPKP